VAERIPTVVVDDLHITYRVHGSGGGGKAAPGAGAGAALRRLASSGRGPGPGVKYIKAVRGVSFVAHQGEAIALIGRNGSGKSTLLKGIAGLLPPSRGRVYTSAQPSLLSVGAALVPSLTGERNVMLGSLALGLSPEEAEERMEWITNFAGIGDFINLPMSTYSSGMGARLRFAIATSVQRDIMLIDEALATGDADFYKRSAKRIRTLRAQAGTVFLVSHSTSVVRDTCTRAIWLDQGRIVMDGRVNQVLKAYEQEIEDNPNRQAGAAR